MTDTPAASVPAPQSLRIATRASQLALWQAHHVAELLRGALPACEIEIVHISTEGDRDRNRALSEMGGVGVFTREVQAAVLDGRADLAVHSLKDLPTESAAGLQLAGVPDRAPVNDALILPASANASRGNAEHAAGTAGNVWQLVPTGARIGTGSLRRQAQLRHFRADLQLLEIRGNVETRLKKLDNGEYDAIVLAEAGLTRLGLADRISAVLAAPLMLHAVGQGALGIECRTDDETTATALSRITNAEVLAAVTAERALLRELRAGCHAPVGVTSRREAAGLVLDGVVLSSDGTQRITDSVSGPVESAELLGIDLARRLMDSGAASLLRAD